MKNINEGEFCLIKSTNDEKNKLTYDSPHHTHTLVVKDIDYPIRLEIFKDKDEDKYFLVSEQNQRNRRLFSSVEELLRHYKNEEIIPYEDKEIKFTVPAKTPQGTNAGPVYAEIEGNPPIYSTANAALAGIGNDSAQRLKPNYNLNLQADSLQDALSPQEVIIDNLRNYINDPQYAAFPKVVSNSPKSIPTGYSIPKNIRSNKSRSNFKQGHESNIEGIRPNSLPHYAVVNVDDCRTGELSRQDLGNIQIKSGEFCLRKADEKKQNKEITINNSNETAKQTHTLIVSPIFKYRYIFKNIQDQFFVAKNKTLDNIIIPDDEKFDSVQDLLKHYEKNNIPYVTKKAGVEYYKLGESATLPPEPPEPPEPTRLPGLELKK